MSNFNKALCAAAFAAVFLISAQAHACFSVVVGKGASATGEIILGHNEDNDRRIVMAQYYVPRMNHRKGEMIVMEPEAAKIPQVGETYAYYWTQTLSPDGYSFSDGFVNEWGVAIVSDNCISSREDKPFIKDGGVGYGIRRIMAERAKTAREAVDIAIDLLNKYGYFHPGRSYQIADKNEAWMLQIVRGNRYAAKRVADGEVALIANAYTIEKIDPNDKENYIVSPDLITHAIEKGWYKPAKTGDYSDFNFRKVYQDDETRTDDYNRLRHKLALKIFTGKDYASPDQYPFSVKADKKVTVGDVKKILRGHSDSEPRENGFFHQNMNDVCNPSTQESVIIQMRAKPELITAWRATGRPCTSPYVPLYPLAGVPSGQNWMNPAAAQAQHFHADPGNFDYNPERALWTFLKLQNYMNFRYDTMPEAHNAIAALENGWAKEQPSVEAAASARLFSAKPAEGIDYLFCYASEQAMLARAAMNKIFRGLDVYNFAIEAETLSQASKGTVNAVLYSGKGFDASKIDRDKTMMGIAYSNGDDELHADLGRPVKYAVKDVNGDGLPDMVMTFNVKDVLELTVPGVKTDLYLFTYNGADKIAAFDTVLVTE